jgi:hypothetical protein
MQFDLVQLPSWFMAIAVVALCAYTGWSLKERNDDFKQALLEIFKRLGTVEQKQEHLQGAHDAMMLRSGGRRCNDPEERP